jgi:sugar/nucleoside kinase (ribokinase family)
VFTKSRNRVFSSPSSDYVLVVGAAHIDVLADYSSANETKMDKIGSVRFSVGGTAFNVAIDIAQCGVPTKLLTVLRNNSFSSIWIRERLEAAGVRSDLLQFSDHIPESGFVAMRSDGDLVTAVTSTAVGEYTFAPQVAEEAVRLARLVMIDCNLAVDQMSLFLDYARRNNRPVVVAAVSDSKVTRLLELERHQLIDVVMLNQLELDEVLRTGEYRGPQSICEVLRANNVIVTDGARGYEVIRASGSRKHYQAPHISDVVSHSGAGDALLAGVLTHWYTHQTLDFDEAATSISTSIRKVLHQPGATAGSLATEVDFALLAKIAIRNEPFWKRMLSPEIGVAAAIIVTILTIGLFVFTYELLPKNPPANVVRPASSEEISHPKDEIQAVPPKNDKSMPIRK